MLDYSACRMNNSSQNVITSSEAIAVQLSLSIVLYVTGVIGNGAICFLVVRFKTLRTIPNILLANLALVDLLNILVNIPIFIAFHVYNEKFFHSSKAAWWTTLSSVLFLQLNLTSMLILVVDRYFGIAYALTYNVWRTRRKTIIAICFAWVTAVGGSASRLGSVYNVELGKKSVFFYRTVYTKSSNNQSITIAATLLLPVLLMVVVSVLTLFKLWQKSRLTKRVTRQMGGSDKRAVSSACTILIVLFSYTVFSICSILLTRKTTSIGVLNKQTQWLFFLARFSFFCGSSCNAFIYTIRSTKFRNALKEMWKSFTRKRRLGRNEVDSIQSKNKYCVFYVNGTFGKQQVNVSQTNSSNLTGLNLNVI